MKYYTKITDLGAEALEFRTSENLEFIIIFNETAPSELREISVIQELTELKDVPEVGDQFIIGDNQFSITAVGEEAIHTLRTLGHCTISFKGLSEVERPGIIEVKGNMIYPGDIKIADEIIIR